MPLIIADTTTSNVGEGERRSRVSIRKRTTTAAAESNIHSSMVTVPEESDYPATNTSEGDTAGGASSNNNSNSSGGGSGNGIVLDESIKSDNGSLIDKMQTALNEEWWSKRQQDWQDQNALPVPAVLQSEEDRVFAIAQQSASAGGEGKKNKRRRGFIFGSNCFRTTMRRTDCIFGILLLSVGFVVGGICIYYDKILMEMTSLWNVASGGGGGGGGSTSSSNAALLREGTRQLPLIDEHDEYHHHPLSYEERQQLYREQRMAGTLRLGQTGYYQQHN
jgi:hypothetical protein